MQTSTKLVLLITICTLAGCNTSTPEEKLPNILFILADDLGYGDLGCYGNTFHRTPNLDRLAAEGLLLSDFYAAASVCTPTRAAFLTGSYPRRVSMHRDSRAHCVLIPGAHKGLNTAELTIAEMLKSKGYATGCFGKWHLGDQKVFLPVNHGFDVYYGVPYSNDMNWAERGDPPLPFVKDTAVLLAPVDQSRLTRLCTDKAIEFITENHEKPFFCYIPYNMPHNPVHASEPFQGRSANGIYGDAVEEMDYSVGRLISVLDSLGIGSNTLVVFTSDNGAARPFGGSNLPLSGWKGSNAEGGFRVPCIINWDKSYARGDTVEQFIHIMDFLPTFAEMVEYELPPDRKIDGKSLLELISSGSDPQLQDRTFYYYYREQLQAVRKGEWKLYLPLEVKQLRWNEILTEGPGQEQRLINLKTDLAEKKDLSKENPEKLKELMKLADLAREDIGDNDKLGRNQRPAGWIDNPEYMKLKLMQ